MGFGVGGGLHHREFRQRESTRFDQLDLVAVRLAAAAIDDEKVGHGVERNERVMPYAARIVHAHAACDGERAHAPFVERPGRCDHDEITRVAQRDEGLAAERTPCPTFLALCAIPSSGNSRETWL